MENPFNTQPNPNTQPPVIEVAQDQYAAALSMVRGLGRINPASFGEDLQWQMGDRDPRTGEIIAPSNIVTSPEQAEAIIEDFQSRGVLSREANEEGLLTWSVMPARSESNSGETTESAGRLKRLAKKAGRFATHTSEDLVKQTREFTGYNPLSAAVLRPSRTKRVAASIEDAKKEDKRQNSEEFDQELRRRNRLRIT